MGFFKFKNKAPAQEKVQYKMITERGNGFYAYNGSIYKSDIVRSCIRPKTKAVGKLNAKHIREDASGIKTFPDVYMRVLLTEPNPLMTMQDFLEKMANQLAVNNNAFALIIRDNYGYPTSIYPISCGSVEAVYKNETTYLKFYLSNGKTLEVLYDDVIHIRNDFFDNDLFGTSCAAALTSLMDIISTADQGIVKAIKNSSAIRWLLKYTTAQRPEDIKASVKQFVEDYLSTETETFGAAGIDAKADIQRIEPKDYVPNAAQTDRTTLRVYNFFNTNEKIINSSANEEEYNSYYEIEIEPIALKLSNEFTKKLFNKREKGYGNKIVFESGSLQCASLKTKLDMVAMVDRGALTPNEWRRTMNYAPIDGGDEPIRRLDTDLANRNSNKEVTEEAESDDNN